MNLTISQILGINLALINKGEIMNIQKWKVVFTEDYIQVHDKEGKILTWTKEEWKEDDNVPFYLANAIVTVAKGNLLP